LLRADDPDLSRAISNGLEPHAVPRKVIVDVMRVGRRESLIIVNPTLLLTLGDCIFLRLAPDRAFSALKPTGTLADLALAVADRLEDADVTREQRAALRRALRTWRQDRKVRVTHKAIVILDVAVHRTISSSAYLDRWRRVAWSAGATILRDGVQPAP
jgi:hypothetical protein